MRRQWRVTHLLAATVFPLVSTAGNSRYVQIPAESTPIGPDGPWWGVKLTLDIIASSGTTYAEWVAYPYAGGYSQFINSTNNADRIATGEAYGAYLAQAPETATQLDTGWRPGGFGRPPVGDLTGDWFTTSYSSWGNTSNVTDAFSHASLWNMPFRTAVGGGAGIQDQRNNSAAFNTSAAVWYNGTSFSLRNGTLYEPSAPLLGLGGTVMGRPEDGAPLGVTAQCKQSGAIGAEFFALHVGSVEPRIEQSLYLGGYDTGRAYGKVGVFGWQAIENAPSTSYYAQVPLLDLKLGTFTGGSPFNFSDQSISLWKFANISEKASSNAEAIGAPKGSTLVNPNSATPWLRMPRGVCAAIAAYLPLEYSEDFGFWLWKTSNSNFSKIVKSPAYLEFVLQDSRQTNVSIKVPFQLLNLTLEAPLNYGNNLQYFPCTEPEEWQLEGGLDFGLMPVYTLGRAFLQAAYFAVNFDKNTTFIAQAPGPGFDSTKRNIIEADPELTNLTSTDIGQWAQTWTKSWTPLPGGSTSDPSAANSSMPGTTDSNQDSATGRRIGLGVGLGLGLPALAAAGILAFVLYRRRQRTRNETAKSGRGVSIMDPSPPAYEDRQGAPKSAAAGAALTSNPTSEVQEIDGGPMRQEIDGRASGVPAIAPPVEMGGGAVSELPADFVYQDRPGVAGGVSRGHSRNVSEVSSSMGGLSPETTAAPGPGSPGMVSLLSPRSSHGPPGQTSPRPLSDDGTVVSSEHEHERRE